MQDGHYIVQMEHLVGVLDLESEELTMSEIMEKICQLMMVICIKLL